MYEELVSRLRTCQEMCEAARFEEAAKLLTQAADTIEELENKLNLWRQDKVSRWIPVTEGVPVIFTCSFFLGWNSVIKWLLCICTIGQFLMLCGFVYFKSDEE